MWLLCWPTYNKKDIESVVMQYFTFADYYCRKPYVLDLAGDSVTAKTHTGGRCDSQKYDRCVKDVKSGQDHI